MSTAYHPQTNGQSERTNQTVEIGLRYHLSQPNSDYKWRKFLSWFVSQLNNASNASTGRSPNEIVYGFKLSYGLPLAIVPQRQTTQRNSSDVISFEKEREINRQSAADAIAFASAAMKLCYDHRQLPLELRPGDEAYLRLHHGCNIPGLPNKKLGYQRVGPFPIIEKVGSPAYRLKLPTHWRIHPVISVAQLEPKPGTDPFGRPRPGIPLALKAEDDTEEWKSFEIESLDNRRIRRLID